MSLPRFPLAAIHAQFADPITYTGAGLNAGEITAIFSDFEDGADMRTLRRVTFEIPFADLPSAPGKGNLIEHESGRWSVIDIERRRDVKAFVLTVEKAP